MKKTILWIIAVLIVIIGTSATCFIIMWVHIKSHEQFTALDGILYGVFIYGWVWLAYKFHKKFLKKKRVD